MEKIAPFSQNLIELYEKSIANRKSTLLKSIGTWMGERMINTEIAARDFVNQRGITQLFEKTKAGMEFLPKYRAKYTEIKTDNETKLAEAKAQQDAIEAAEIATQEKARKKQELLDKLGILPGTIDSIIAPYAGHNINIGEIDENSDYVKDALTKRILIDRFADPNDSNNEKLRIKFFSERNIGEGGIAPTISTILVDSITKTEKLKGTQSSVNYEVIMGYSHEEVGGLNLNNYGLTLNGSPESKFKISEYQTKSTAARSIVRSMSPEIYQACNLLSGELFGIKDKVGRLEVNFDKQAGPSYSYESADKSITFNSSDLI